MERQLRPDLHPAGHGQPAALGASARRAIEHVLFASPVLTVGQWRCPPGHPRFRNSGPTSHHLFVFPRERVVIRHDGDAARGGFMADANTVTFYNRGQEYTRRAVSPRGDRCEWFAVGADTLCEVLSAEGLGANVRDERPFAFAHGPSDAQSYWRQRAVWLHLSRTPTPQPDALFVEETMLQVLGDVAAAAARLHAAPRRRAPAASRPNEVAEAAREMLARERTVNMSLGHLARRLGLSPFHLARTFRRGTGFTLHRYRTELRLRTALERLTDTDEDLSSMALDLGFSSHSHFTAAFRRSFGTTPSLVRRAAGRAPRGPG